MRMRAGCCENGRRSLPVPALVLALALATSPAGADETAAPAGAGETVGVLGAGAQGLAVATTESTFTYPLRLVRNAPGGGALDVTLEVPVLVGPDGATFPIRLERGGAAVDGPVTLPPLRVVELSLVGGTPVAGTYATELGLVYGGRRHGVPLTVTRTRPPAPVSFLGAVPVARTLGGDGVRLKVRLEQSEGAPLTVYRPAFVALDRKAGDATVQADYSGPTYQGADGKPVGPTLDLVPGVPVELTLTLHDLTDPGRYEGTLQVGAVDHLPVQQAVTLVLRRDWPLAALLIAIGVGLSAALRWYGQTERPRLVLQRRGYRLRQQLEGFRGREDDLSVRERGLLDAVLGRLDEVLARLEGGEGTTAEAETALDEAGRKLGLLPAWIALRRRIDAVRPTAAAAAVRSEQAADGAFFARTGTTAEEAAALRARIDALGDKLTEDVRTALLAAIAALETEVAERAAAPPETVAREVGARLREARDEAEARRLGAARIRLDQARRAWTDLLVAAFRRELAASAPPVGLTAADWTALQGTTTRLLDGVAEETDADRAGERYRDAYARYLAALLDAAARVVSERLAAQPATVDAARQALETARDGLAGARAALDAGRLAAAADGYGKAIGALAAPASAGAGGGLMGGRAAVAPLAGGAGAIAAGEVPAGAGEGEARAPADMPVPAAAALAALRARQRQLDLLLLLAMLVVAILLGLQVLWLDDPDWGTPGDLIVAMLWGLGLHQVAGSAFQGLHGLYAQFAETR